MGSTRNALVTGASARIGLALARRLAAAGYAVVLHASPRSAALADAEAEALRAAGLRAAALAADLADPAACSGLVAAAAAVHGPLTLLVNNAAVFEPDSAAAIDLAVWDRQFAINLRAPALLAAAFAAQVPTGSARGDASIVNLVDQRVLRPSARDFSYTLTKAALWAATQSAAQAFAARGIRVNAVGPGPVLPNAHDGERGFASEVAGLPLRRAVATADIADAVLYLAGARAVTGTFLAVDGGQHLGTGLAGPSQASGD